MSRIHNFFQSTFVTSEQLVNEVRTCLDNKDPLRARLILLWKGAISAFVAAGSSSYVLGQDTFRFLKYKIGLEKKCDDLTFMLLFERTGKVALYALLMVGNPFGGAIYPRGIVAAQNWFKLCAPDEPLEQEIIRIKAGFNHVGPTVKVPQPDLEGVALQISEKIDALPHLPQTPTKEARGPQDPQTPGWTP